MISYRNQKESGFFNTHNVRLVPFPIQDANGQYKFKNSEIIVRYMFAIEQLRSGASLGIIDRIFNHKNSEGVYYQTKFNEDYSQEQAISKLESWIREDGFDEDGISELRKIVNYPEITDKINQNKEIVELSN